MKLMIASDIHGSAKWCARMLDLYRSSGAQRLILLGDILYHGPRNDLPEAYAPKQVVDLLTPYARQILCVRGNCEAEVDAMVLPFPCMAESALIFDGYATFYAIHGHKAGPDDPPPLPEGDVLLYGHTHIPAFERRGGLLGVNPGSVSIPKAGSAHGAILYRDGAFDFIDLEDGRAWRRERLTGGDNS